MSPEPEESAGQAKGQLGHLADPAGAPIHGLGAGKRIRTPPPQPIPAPLEETDLGVGQIQQDEAGHLQGPLQNSTLLESLGASQLTKKLGERAVQLRDFQDFLQNPSLLDLHGKELDTSSTADEIEARKGEIRYRIQIMRSMLAVLTDELSELEQARPQASAGETPSTYS
jgi:hypothetical protein